jgi:protein arginine kinase activator
MKCDRCDKEATVHEVVVRGGKKVEKHLCEACAREEGIVVQSESPLSELLGKYVQSKSDPEPAKPPPTPEVRGAACPSCGLVYSDFRKSGLLGCPECYRAFESQLGPLLERTHEGATNHTGKIPRRALAASRLAGHGEDLLGSAEERTRRVTTLRRQLGEAIESEQYERAAKLRDEIQRLMATDPGEERVGSADPEQD